MSSLVWQCNKCFKNKSSSINYAHICYFVVPLALCMLINVILFILIVCNLNKTFKNSQSLQQTKKKRKDALVYAKVLFVLGLSWLVGFIAQPVDHDVLWVIFILLNASQGTLIVLVFEVNWDKVIHVVQTCKNKFVHKHDDKLTQTDGTVLNDNNTQTCEYF